MRPEAAPPAGAPNRRSTAWSWRLGARTLQQAVGFAAEPTLRPRVQVLLERDVPGHLAQGKQARRPLEASVLGDLTRTRSRERGLVGAERVIVIAALPVEVTRDACNLCAPLTVRVLAEEVVRFAERGAGLARRHQRLDDRDVGLDAQQAIRMRGAIAFPGRDRLRRLVQSIALDAADLVLGVLGGRPTPGDGRAVEL